MPASKELEQRLRDEIMRVDAIDVHSHVPASEPFARSLRDILGYHYYTELAHSAGMSKDAIAPNLPDEQMIPRLLDGMVAISNTVQYSWLIELARELFGFEEGRLTRQNWQPLADAVASSADRPGRAGEIMRLSHIEKVFLTNNFDEDLAAIDRKLFVPCLRADALVFNMAEGRVRKALARVSGIEVADGQSLSRALGAVVEGFRQAGAKSAAISLPPGFQTFVLEDGDMGRALGKAARGVPLARADEEVLRSGAFFELVGLCRECGLPVQVMCGALRDAYAHGVPQGTDLPQSGDSLRGLLPVLNAFPEVTFCLSVLSDSQVQELTSYGWIVQNVVLSGHWWYANVPAYIARDLAARLQSVPKTKLIGYYSDMYKLEFGLAKFNMYRRVLARALARDFVEAGLGTETQALETARLLLRENAIRIFRL